jgi:hypothetical protein
VENLAKEIIELCQQSLKENEDSGNKKGNLSMKIDDHSLLSFFESDC